MTRVIVCCGVGGAGKTTTAAALGLAHAMTGRRVVVLTIDPARRLADALGISQLGNTPVALPLPEGAPAGAALHALMLDRKATWDEVVRKHAPDAETAERVVANRYYAALSERLTGGHEYMATEKLYGLVEAGTWDVVVVDTPPTQHALDFFSAPDRIQRILDRRLIGTLLDPGQGLLGAATRRVAGVVRRLAGEAVIDDLAEFFQLIAGLSHGFRERGKAVHDLLRSPDCRFLLVVHANAPRTDDVLDFVRELRRQRMHFDGCLINRTIAPLQPTAERIASALPAAPAGLNPAAWDAAMLRLAVLARRHDERAAGHTTLADDLERQTGATVWPVPDQRKGIESLDALATLARFMPS
jgi:anion-transporting  ArsA/GET3 family ATPase